MPHDEDEVLPPELRSGVQDGRFITTSSMAVAIGLNGPISARWIADVLGVKWKYVNQARTGYYWTRDQVSEARRALIARLVAIEFGDPKSPFTTEPKK